MPKAKKHSTKDFFTKIVVILDKSGSMWNAASDTIGGFNKFLSDQKKVKGKANLTLVQFDTTYNFVHKGVDIQDVPELNKDTYQTGGMTALLDAVGRAIIETEREIEVADQKPDQVLFMIVTDGEENSSKEIKRDQLFKMVQDKQKKDDWSFVFVGADINSYDEGGQMGFYASTTSNYDKGNTAKLYNMMSDKVAMYRSTGKVDSLEFTDDERKDLEGDKDA